MFPSAKHLLVALLGVAVLYVLRTVIWPRLGRDVPNTIPCWFSWNDILGILIFNIVEVLFEEGLFRGIPWGIFLLFGRVFGERRPIVLFVGAILFLIFNWLWTKGHTGTPHSRRAVFLSGLFYGWLLFWSGRFLTPVLAHWAWNGIAAVDACRTNNYQRRKPL